MAVTRETLDDRRLEEGDVSRSRLVAEIRKLRRVVKRLHAFTTGASRERFDSVCADEDLDMTVL